MPWLFWAWCYAHHLELACKDAFSSHLFKDFDEMLLRLYYLYEKSPKKCRELSDLMDDLKEVFEFPEEGGNLPVRAHGSRTREKHYRGLWTDMELTSSTW